MKFFLLLIGLGFILAGHGGEAGRRSVMVCAPLSGSTPLIAGLAALMQYNGSNSKIVNGSLLQPQAYLEEEFERCINSELDFSVEQYNDILVPMFQRYVAGFEAKIQKLFEHDRELQAEDSERRSAAALQLLLLDAGGKEDALAAARQVLTQFFLMPEVRRYPYDERMAGLLIALNRPFLLVLSERVYLVLGRDSRHNAMTLLVQDMTTSFADYRVDFPATRGALLQPLTVKTSGEMIFLPTFQLNLILFQKFIVDQAAQCHIFACKKGMDPMNQ